MNNPAGSANTPRASVASARSTALARAHGRVVICGNLDPTFIHAGPPSAVRAEARRLLDATTGNRAFVLSSGCDLPPGTPLENVEALCDAVDAVPTREPTP